VGTAPTELACLFVCFVILAFIAAGSEPTETMASVSVCSVGKYWRRRGEVNRQDVRELRFCMCDCE
jgi:hypothetical protein